MARKPKGMDFEEEVARFVEKSLGFNSTVLRELVKGETAIRPWECDVHAEKYAPMWDYLKTGGYVISGLAVASILFGMKDLENFLGQLVALILPGWSDKALLVCGVGGAFAGKYGKKHGSKHAWIECKNLKGSVKRDHIIKLKEEVSDVRAIEEPEWKPDEVLFFSGSKFDQDAINLAHENGIVCYVRDGDTFRLVD